MSTLRVDNVTDLGDDPVVTAGVVAGGALPAGSILQVVSTTKTSTFTGSTTQGTFIAVTGLSASITPSSTSSKIYVQVNVSSGSDSDINRGQTYRLTRGGSPIALGDASGSRTQATFASNSSSTTDRNISSVGMNFLDSPASTSSQTYAVEVSHEDASATVNVNRSKLDDSNVSSYRPVSTITLMEVAG